jgi:dCTP deaminase
MSCLNSKDILKEIDTGNIFIWPYDSDNLQINSYDVTLGDFFYRENQKFDDVYNIWNEEDVNEVWKLNESVSLEKAEQEISEYTKKECKLKNIHPQSRIIWLKPFECILAHTNEFIGSKNNITTMMHCRSSLARSSISVCLCAGLGDIGYQNRWTMEIKNHSKHVIPLIVNKRIAQIVFFYTNPIDKKYNGKYQNGNDIHHLIDTWKPEQMLPKLYLDKDNKADWKINNLLPQLNK